MDIKQCDHYSNSTHLDRLHVGEVNGVCQLTGTCSPLGKKPPLPFLAPRVRMLMFCCGVAAKVRPCTSCNAATRVWCQQRGHEHGVLSANWLRIFHQKKKTSHAPSGSCSPTCPEQQCSACQCSPSPVQQPAKPIE
jgi:hypothetical protein